MSQLGQLIESPPFLQICGKIRRMRFVLLWLSIYLSIPLKHLCGLYKQLLTAISINPFIDRLSVRVFSDLNTFFYTL